MPDRSLAHSFDGKAAPAARAARIGEGIFVICALFVPFALAVFSMGTELAMPTIAQGILLLPLLLLPVWALHKLRIFKSTAHEPTLYD